MFKVADIVYHTSGWVGKVEQVKPTGIVVAQMNNLKEVREYPLEGFTVLVEKEDLGDIDIAIQAIMTVCEKHKQVIVPNIGALFLKTIYGLEQLKEDGFQ